MKTTTELIGERIKAQRERLKLSQTVLANKIGLNEEFKSDVRGIVSRWEIGKVKPSAENLVKLCELFGCEIGYLFGEIDGLTRATSDICAETGLRENEAQGLAILWKHAKQKRGVKVKDRQNPFANAHTALRKLLPQNLVGLYVLSYINLYLDASGTAEIKDPAFNSSGVTEEDIALAAIIKELTRIKQAQGGEG